MSHVRVLVCTDSQLLASQAVTGGWVVVVGEAGGREQEPSKQKQRLDAKVSTWKSARFPMLRSCLC